MKQLLLVFFLFFLLFFNTRKAEAQQPQTVIDFFLLLPDTVFTTIKELNFAPNDSFSVRERTKMIANYDERKSTFSITDPRFHIVSENEKNRLLTCTNNELFMNVKVWSLNNNESMVAVEGSYKDDWNTQTVKFYNYKEGKISMTYPLPESFPIKLFFDSTYCEKQYVDPEYAIPHQYIEFMQNGDNFKVRVQAEIFNDQIVGPIGHPLTRLNIARIKCPWILLTLRDDKFVITR